MIFKANFIPVGRDQIQHIEMCRDIATRFNQMYGNGEEIFPLPDAVIDEDTAIFPGLDVRMMREAIMKIVTD